MNLKTDRDHLRIEALRITMNISADFGCFQKNVILYTAYRCISFSANVLVRHMSHMSKLSCSAYFEPIWDSFSVLIKGGESKVLANMVCD